MDTTTETIKLPKYIQNANKILCILAEQDDKVWAKTQRELGVLLGFSQPELSTLLKLLFEQGKIKKGSPLPGVRGKNYVIELVDAAPFDRPVTRRAKPYETEDRVLTSEEMVSGPMDLQDISIEKIGMAVTRALRDAWEKEERHSQIRIEQMERIREFREQITTERRLRTQLVADKENLERQLHEMEHAQSELRAQLNKMVMTANEKGTYRVRDLLKEDEIRALEQLMKAKPGHYRESDEAIA